MSKANASTNEFKFKQLDQIGATAAEQDRDFLRACFVDTGVLEVLQRVEDHRFLVVGGTGSGKSALLAELENREQRVIRLNPESLALQYVCNSNVLAQLDGLGVHLDVFYKMLWRHIFAVELLRARFPEISADSKEGILARLESKFRQSKRDERKAIEYLKKWGQSSFWEDSQYRVREITTKLESELGAKVEIAQALSASGKEALSETRVKEAVRSSQQVISTFQAHDLGALIDLVDRVLDDAQKQYFVVVDMLDHAWVEEARKHRLIAALLDTAREMTTRVANAKVVVALRTDLFERTFRLARPAGFQKEKYDSSAVYLRWNADQLLETLDRRVSELVRRRYTSTKVGYAEVLPPKVHGEPLTAFLGRHLRRPRDVIQFFNACIEEAQGSPRLGVEELQRATGRYSRSRFHALCDEWAAEFPHLDQLRKLFEGRPGTFKVSSLVRETLFADLGIALTSSPSEMERTLASLLCDNARADRAAAEIAVAMYRVGLVGLKLASYEKASWLEASGRDISAAEIADDTSVQLHPAFYRALGIT